MKGFLFFIICMLMSTCHTIEIPIDMVSKEKPVFEVTGTFGNKSISIAAGKDNFVLSTNFDKLNFQVLQMTGNLRAQSCDVNCRSSLRLHLRQHIVEFNNQLIKSIPAGRRSFYRVERDSILLKSTNLSSLSNSSNAKLQFIWTVNDRKTSEDENILVVNNGIESKICLKINHPDGSTANNCQLLDFNPFDSIPGLRINITSTTVNKIQRLEVKVIGKGPFKFNWEGNKTTESIMELEAKQTSQCVTVTDVNGNKVTECVALNPEGKIKLKSEFKIDYDTRRIFEIAQYNTIELFYIDTDGVVWSSSSKVQPGGSVFEIVEDTPYDLNDKGQPTRKLKIKMDGLMFNTKGESTNLKLTGSFGVAVPPK